MLNRRSFLKASAAAIAAPAIVRGQNLNSKLQMASVGCANKGWSDTREMARHERVRHVAFCDVDLAMIGRVRELQPEAPIYQDYRTMLDEVGDRIDALTVSTPDHMHAKVTLDAMRLGKHVYCQKPLTHNVWEARQVRLGAQASGVITRMGNQIHSHTSYRTAVRAIQDGIIGKVKEVRSWCRATGHGKSGYEQPPENPAVPPESLAWNLWIGGAPMRPFGAPGCYHPKGWRDWQDFGNGALGDFGCHILDPVFTALEIDGGPTQLTADHTGPDDQVWPTQTEVAYVFPGTRYTAGDDVSITWTDGGRQPSLRGSHLSEGEELPRSGSMFIGEEGTLLLPHVGELRLYPQSKYADVTIEPAEDLNHYHGWVDGCLSGQQPTDGFTYAGPLTEAVLLGNIAVRFRGQTLNWDEDQMRVTNIDEANRWLKRNNRDRWEIVPIG